MNRITTYFKDSLPGHLVFWTIVYLYFVLSVHNLSMFASYRHLLETYGLIVLAQMITAYTCIYILMPKYLDRKKTGLFIFWMLTVLILVYTFYQGVKLIYFDVEYFDFYDEVQRKFAKDSLLKRLSYFSVFLSKCIVYLTPTALLLMYRFYRNQQKLLKINEQKKIAELSALKQQLNPHFLFNTLNNLYSLALEKSERTPEVIERLSDILDYMLYRTKDKFVQLQKEIELIENYLALEKIRYGNRVAITFNYEIPSDIKIAPLLILTFIENAFKHGVRQELKQASIDISLKLVGEDILIKIKNTKPNSVVRVENREEALGLKNVKRQLELLYPNAYELQLSDEESTYIVQLTLERK
ncbi:hypothetical protein FEE95_01290 [Maribacter algarum]|uniref:Signal transduction histidine kinase internal region domain-containing protein n=1 Tax=Maribacter algarum (ex Zhang et al. 2020) TaxID=2578118 RepID=A0A5S3PSW8_9FLAO|nr:histidine kinase [Maribacter algarum]TMM58089.1 hypothetical protein FEE95_01290 [Maribacter algarum]